MVLSISPLIRRDSDSRADALASSTSPRFARRTLEPVTHTNPTSSGPPSPAVVCADGSSKYTEINYQYPIQYNLEDTDPLEVLYDAGTGVNQHLAPNGDGLISGAMN